MASFDGNRANDNNCGLERGFNNRRGFDLNNLGGGSTDDDKGPPAQSNNANVQQDSGDGANNFSRFNNPGNHTNSSNFQQRFGDNGERPNRGNNRNFSRGGGDAGNRSGRFNNSNVHQADGGDRHRRFNNQNVSQRGGHGGDFPNRFNNPNVQQADGGDRFNRSSNQNFSQRGGHGGNFSNRSNAPAEKIEFFDNGKPGDDEAGEHKEREAPKFIVREDDAVIYGEEANEKIQTFEAPKWIAPPTFEPSSRDIDAVFQEDEENASKYAIAVDEDEEIYVDGIGGNLSRIDKWADCVFPESLMKNINRSSYLKPRQIQRATVPLILDGYDVIGHAETGSGKTAAYVIPIIAGCMEAKQEGKFSSAPYHPFALIICPTRELVKQCCEQAKKFAHETDVSVAKAYGDYPTQTNKAELEKGCDILFVTPGRFKDFVSKGFISPNLLRFFVLDEGDTLLEDFMYDIKPVMDKPSFPKKEMRQTLIFSATFNDNALAKAREITRPDLCAYVTNKKNITNKKCIQEFLVVPKVDKFKHLRSYFEKELAKVGDDPKKLRSTLVFTRERSDCEKVTMGLATKNIHALPLSGMRSQDLREDAFDKFRDHQVPVLVVTDVLARGIDIKNLDIVINFDLPRDVETYVHRAGRVGRIDIGHCISYVNIDRDMPTLQKIYQAFIKDHTPVPETLQQIIDQAAAAPPKFSGGVTGFESVFQAQEQPTEAKENDQDEVAAPETDAPVEATSREEQPVEVQSKNEALSGDQPPIVSENEQAATPENVQTEIADIVATPQEQQPAEVDSKKEAASKDEHPVASDNAQAAAPGNDQPENVTFEAASQEEHPAEVDTKNEDQHPVAPGNEQAATTETIQTQNVAPVEETTQEEQSAEAPKIDQGESEAKNGADVKENEQMGKDA